MLFSDLEGFTKMSHAIEPEMVAKLLNRYLDLLSQVVLDHGGVIDKFVGDAVVAFWGAPISRPDDGTRAAKAGYAIWQAGEAFRAEVAAMDPDLPRIGKTRVGLHFGEAVIGVPATVSAMNAVRQMLGLPSRDVRRLDYRLRGKLGIPLVVLDHVLHRAAVNPPGGVDTVEEGPGRGGRGPRPHHTVRQGRSRRPRQDVRPRQTRGRVTR